MEASSTSAASSSSINCLDSVKLIEGLSPNSANGHSALPPDHSSKISSARLDKNATAPSNPAASVSVTLPKIILRFGTNNNKRLKSDQHVAEKKESPAASDGDGDCNNNKRPRREIKKTTYYRDAVMCASRVGTTSSTRSKTSRLHPQSRKFGENKANKLRCPRIQLTRAEVEEDILVMTGGMETCPTKKDKNKRSLKVQQELDIRFPGLLLPYINFGSYANRRSKS